MLISIPRQSSTATGAVQAMFLLPFSVLSCYSTVKSNANALAAPPQITSSRTELGRKRYSGTSTLNLIEAYQAERSLISSSDRSLAITDMISCVRLPDLKAFNWVSR